MIVISHLKGVKNFSCNSNGLMCVFKNKITLNDDVIFTSDEDCFGKSVSTFWLTVADYKRYKLMNLQGISYELSFTQSPLWFTFNEVELTVLTGFNSRLLNDNEQRVYDFGLLNIRTQEILSLELTYSYPSNINGHYVPFLIGKRAIDLYNIETKQLLSFTLPEEFGSWYHSFDQKWMDGEIHQIIAVVNNTLWIAVSGHHLIGIDTQTGQLQHDLSYAHQIIGTPTKDYHRQLPVTFRLEHDAKLNLLFGFIYDTYVEVDLNQTEPTLTMYVLEETCTQQQAFCAYSDRTCFDDQYFYYLDPMSGKIGGVNRQAKTLDWVYSFPDESTMGFLMQIQVADPRLYVLDSGGVLHILEREVAE